MRARRLDDFEYCGPHRYSLTFCTYQRRALFTDTDLVHVMRTQILRAGAERSFEISAYCFMPDHLHLLVRGSNQDACLPRFAKHAKQLSGYHGRRHTRRKIWQAGFFDRLLNEAEDARGVIAYLLMNPVRAGLAARPEEYPFSGSGICELPELVDQVRPYL